MTDEEPQLQVRCGRCNGLMGILVQRRIPSGTKDVEVLKVNSMCLHFVDRDADTEPGIMSNCVANDTDVLASRGPSGERTDDTDDDDDDLEMRMQEVDFDDLDVIGTNDGVSKAEKKRREQRELWKRCTPSGGATLTGSKVNDDERTTTEERHGGVGGALNEYSSSSSEEESDESESDDEEQ
jgi:hypothetical protein